jgi:hypothetical protein
VSSDSVITIVQFLLWAVLGLIGLLFAGFILLIVVMSIYTAYTNRRDLRFLSAFACPKCETVLGRAPVLAAKDRYEQKIRELSKNLRVILRLASPIWEIECPRCSFKFLYHPTRSRIEIPSEAAATA